MKFEQQLLVGTLIKRYKRFLADVQLADGSELTVHTPNTGSMMGCCTPGSRVWLSDSGNPDRKYRHSWEMVESLPGVITGINTHLANKLVQEAINTGVITELQGYDSMRAEVKYGRENSRIDILLESAGRSCCFVEVKNVTLVDNNTAYFPDAVSKRGTRHLRELEQIVRDGQRGVILFCIQRNDAREFRPADHIDAEYGKQLRDSIAAGVEALAYQALLTPSEIRLVERLPVTFE